LPDLSRVWSKARSQETICSRSATLHKLTIIGEASARLSDDLKARYSDVEWRDIVAFRNIAVHSYFSVDWAIVWVAATTEAPALRTQVLQILSAEYPQSPFLAWMNAQTSEQTASED